MSDHGTVPTARPIVVPPLPNPQVADVVVPGPLDVEVSAVLATLAAHRLSGRSGPDDDGHDRWRRVYETSSVDGRPTSTGWMRVLDPSVDPILGVVRAVAAAALSANAAHHRFDLDRIDAEDPPELHRLDRSDWRAERPDLSDDFPDRKLTAIVPIGDGLRFTLAPGGPIGAASGDIAVFPAFTAWGVESLDGGSFLVLRLHGRAFR